MAENAARIVAPGHAWRGFQTSAYGDRRYVCECGDKGSPVPCVDDARDEHRQHKRQVTTPHAYRQGMLMGRRCGECGLPEGADVHAAASYVEGHAHYAAGPPPLAHVHPCPKCNTDDHADWPDGTFGAHAACLRAQAEQLGYTHLVDQVDALRRNVAEARDGFLRDEGLIP